MTGSHIDTVRTGGRYDGNSACWPASRWCETLDTAGVAHAPSAGGRPSSPTRRARASRRTCWARWSTPAACRSRRPSTPAPIDGAAVGDELQRIGYAGPAPVPAAAAARLRRAAHRAGPGAGRRGRPDRRGAERAGHLVAGGDHHRPVQPRRHHADAAAARRRATSRRRSAASCATWRARWAAARSPRWARSTLHPNLVNVVAARADADGGSAQHRRGHAAARPSGGWPAFFAQLAARRGCRDRRPAAGALRAGGVRRRRGRRCIERRPRRLGLFAARA